MISGLPISNELLEKLKEKLNVGNLRSIQLNCIPGKSSTRLDLSDIEIIEDSLPKDFVDKLLNHSNKFSFNISFDNLDLNIGSESEAKEKKLGLLSKRLNRLTNYNKEDLQEYGYESFGFGFPIITYRPQEAPNKVIKAPLFIWHLSIKKDLSKTNTWNISRDTDQEIEFNNLLRSYIGQISGIRIEDFSEEELLDGVLDFDELLVNTIKFVSKFSNSDSETLETNFTQGFKEGIKSIPQKKEVEQIATSIPNVIWGGVFGRYHLRNEAIRQEVNEKLIEVIDEGETELEDNVDALMHSETAALTDPSQMGILNFLKENNHLIIQGPPGTGKSESITGIILNALEHGKKCLVVCEKKTAMNVLKNNLSDIDPKIGKLVAVIDDVSRDRKQIVDSIRDRYDQQGNSHLEIPKSTNLANLVELIEEQIRDIHYRKHFFYDKNIVESFKIKGWTATVGEQLKAKLNNANDSLFETLNEALSFSERIDYLKTLDFLKRFEIETENINYKNLLNFLSEEDLKNSNPAFLKDRLLDLTVSNVDEFENFIHDFKNHIDRCKREIDEIVDDSLQILKKNVSELSELKYSIVNTKLFKSDNHWLSILRKVASDGSKLSNQINSYDKALDLIKNTRKEFEKLRFKVPTQKERSINNVISIINSYEKAVLDVQNELNDIKSQILNDLINQPFQQASLSSEMVNEYDNWKNNVYPFIKEFQNADEPSDDLLEHIKKLEWVLSCSKKFKLANEEGFIQHFEWQQTLRSQDTFNQDIVRLLRKSAAKNWASHFTEFYLYHKLKNNFDLKLASGYDAQIQYLEEKKEKIVDEIKTRIPNYWKAKQSQIDNVNIPQLYNKRGSRGRRRNSLRKIANRSFESLTAYFPVIMASPNICASIFELKPELFDYVIFDEASQLKIEESISTLIRGKRKIISGDSNQMPPSYWFAAIPDDLTEDFDDDYDPYQSWEENLQTREGAADLADSESLLEFAELCGFESFKLDFHYRSHHPLLIEFSNAAFYKSRLHPLPERISHSPIQFIPVNGLYESQQNRDEANIAVAILKQIKRNNDGELPSVGIATFNQKQKNLILETIKREVQLDQKFRNKYLEFENNGLFIKNLENIQGDERDVIILSTTYGRREDENFSRAVYGPTITRPRLGRRMLNVIVTRAKKKMFVLTSIPEDYYMDFDQELNGDRFFERGYFHAYLAYAKAVSENDKKSIESVLKVLKSNSSSNHNVESLGYTESPFEEAVYQMLIQKVNEERIVLQHKAGGFRIDIAVKSKVTGREFIAIECDGATYHGSAEAYAWDAYRQNILEKHGFVFHRIWSREYWENPKREIEKLVHFIHEQDKIDREYQIPENPSTADIFLDELLSETDITYSSEDTVDKDTAPKEKFVKKTSEEESRQINIQYEIKDRPKVEIGQVVKLKELENNKEFKVKLALDRTNVKVSNGVTILDKKSPIGEAILGRKVGDTVELNNLEKYYKIISVES